MLSKKLVRLHDFGQVFENSTRINSAYFSLLFRTNSLAYTRLGLSISKKKISTAVARNRVKRIVRECCRNHPIINCGVDVVFLAKARLTELDKKELRKCLMQKLDLLITYV